MKKGGAMKARVLLVLIMVVFAIGAFAAVTFSIAMSQCETCCMASNGTKTVSVSPYASSMNLLINE